MARVMLCAAVAARAASVERALLASGHDIVARVDSVPELAQRAGDARPDTVVIDLAAPDAEAFAALRLLHERSPCAVAMFTSEAGRATIEDAVRAGVGAYVVDGWNEARLTAVIELAIARFHQMQSLERGLHAAEHKLAERKLVERAKGILMRTRHMGEDQAYRALRKMAMDKNLKLAQVAQHVIAVSELLAE